MKFLTSSVETQRWKWLLRFIWLELSLKYHSNDCNQLQLVFVTDHLQQKKLDDTNVSNNYLLFKSAVFCIFVFFVFLYSVFSVFKQLHSVFSYYAIAWKASKLLTVFAKNLWCSNGFYTPLASLVCVSYLAISMIIATLTSCDQITFEVNLYVLFKYVCVYFVRLETEFREIRHSWQTNEITCLNKKYFSIALYL